MARKGIGGFSEGLAGEEEAIFEERVTTGQEEIANYTTLIDQLRADGLGRIEARTKAREIVEEAKTRGMTTAQALATAVNARRTGEKSRQTQLEVAKLYANRPSGSDSDFNRKVRINAGKLRYDHPNIAEAVIQAEAKRMIEQEDRVTALVASADRNTAVIANLDEVRIQGRADLMRGSLFRSSNSEQQAALLANHDAQFDAAISDVTNRRAAAVTDISQSLLTPAQANGIGAIPLPATEAELIVGQLYNTLDQGPAIWDGTQFTN